MELDATTEIDFALLLEDDRHDEQEINLLLGEAKSLGRFEPHDVARARRLRERFPDAVLIFATLRDALTDEEKAAITLSHDRRSGAVETSLGAPRVLVLTATELFAPEGAPDCWKDAGGRASELAHIAERHMRAEVSNWADLTLQLHVGLERHDEWCKAEAERLRGGERGPGHHGVGMARGRAVVRWVLDIADFCFGQGVLGDQYARLVPRRRERH